MSKVAKEAMDSPAASAEEEVENQQETSQEETSSPNKSSNKISGKLKILTGMKVMIRAKVVTEIIR